MNNAVSVITTLIFFGSMAALPGVAVYYVVKATRNRRRARADTSARHARENRRSASLISVRTK